jgi:hypothetical protein
MLHMMDERSNMLASKMHMMDERSNMLAPKMLPHHPQQYMTQPIIRKFKQKEYSHTSSAKKRRLKHNTLVVWLPRVVKNWDSHLVHMPNTFDPSIEFQVTSTSGTKLAHFLPGAINGKAAMEAYKATVELQKAINPAATPNTRTTSGKAVQMSFGEWRRSAKEEEVGPQTAQTKMHLTAVRQWKERVEHGLLKCVQQLLRMKVPLFAKFLEALSPHQHWSFAGFSVCTVNFNYGALKPHTDDKNHHDAYCVVIPLGQYTGGELCFSFAERDVVIPLQQGDAVIMQGANLKHYVKDYTGNRYSLVLHTCYCLVRDLMDKAVQTYNA